MYVSSVGPKSTKRFLVNPIVVHTKSVGAEQLPVSVAVSYSVDAFE